MDNFHFYKSDRSTQKHRRLLPHWGQEGALHFVTFRLYDSLPSIKLEPILDREESGLLPHLRRPERSTIRPGPDRRVAHCTAATPNPTGARFPAWRRACGRDRARDFSSLTERYREKENWRRLGNRGRAAHRSYTGVLPTSEQPWPAS